MFDSCTNYIPSKQFDSTYPEVSATAEFENGIWTTATLKS